MHIDVILSPDLQLEEQRRLALEERLKVAKKFKAGDRVKAGIDGHPGVLVGISSTGMAAIRWECGSILTGVEATNLLPE